MLGLFDAAGVVYDGLRKHGLISLRVVVNYVFFVRGSNYVTTYKLLCTLKFYNVPPRTLVFGRTKEEHNLIQERKVKTPT